MNDSAKTIEPKPPIRGFMPFTEGAVVQGILHAICKKPNGTGFFLIKITNPCTVNVLDADSKTGQATAMAGEIVGIRKTGASSVLAELEIGTMVRVTYLELQERTVKVRETGKTEARRYHHIVVDVYGLTKGNQ